MKVENTKLDGVMKITPPTIFEDFRGSYIETYNKRIYQDNGIDIDFIQDDVSISRKNVLRGIHGDKSTTKLVSCLQGEFYLVVVNNIKESSQYKKWESFYISETNRFQILIPKGFGNGHLVLSERAIFHYKQDTEYNRAGQFTIKWNDPNFSFWWPINDPMTSLRDKG